MFDLIKFGYIPLVLSQLLFMQSPSDFQYNQSMLQAFYFIVYAEAEGEELTFEDWIGAFNGEICVGAGQWSGPYTTIPVMGDSGDSWTEGYMLPGQYPDFIIYDHSEGAYYHAEVSVNYPWQNNAFYNIDSLPLDEWNFPESLNIETYPNPSNSIVSINLETLQMDYYHMRIFDVNGKLIEPLYEGNLSPGLHLFNWNASDVSSGLYFLDILNGGISSSKPRVKTVKKLLILK